MKSRYCIATQNGRDHGTREMNHHQPHQRSVFKEDNAVFMVGLEESPLIWAPSGKPNDQFQQVLLPVRPAESSTRRKVNRKCIIFQQDNARSHVSLVTKQKLFQGSSGKSSFWEVLIYLPYSSDIEPWYFHLSWSLQDSLNWKNFNSFKDYKRHLEQFFAQKDKLFWEDRIMKLPEKYQKAVQQNGQYIIQWWPWWKWKKLSFIFT